ncbi:wsv149 [White spot syndrome virus]|uniref:Wsv149 n=4 Tax=White spot syndrome virus TaxID=342409 RepID=Q8VB48_WSSVS|nr:wsv149 [Shrimp white spot syndrome virus]AFX59525.1 wsv149 [White spot syndrome virus]AAL33153.1 wsv149 [Shrimp white spot syndrome virus]AAL89072.1 WSSV204 [Shrimp white spot syndrome virus]AWQ60332.1 wsv149 [Shrimp white spot syndrome virus]AWQ60746.1 wsv149 [Shrimp white spot syndrome virus]
MGVEAKSRALEENFLSIGSLCRILSTMLDIEVLSLKSKKTTPFSGEGLLKDRCSSMVVVVVVMV